MTRIETKFDVDQIVAYKTGKTKEIFGRVVEIKKNKDGLYYVIDTAGVGSSTIPEDQVIGALSFGYMNDNVAKAGQPA
ncbi:MAG: hypothetical protein J7501_03950 [Bdellovibrio sp.]|nr:hypothetical protein [Bdellovibrio sp.]